MKVEDVYQFFGSANKASKAIGIVRATFSVWVRNGYIPFRKQKKIESITNGKLIAKHEDAINPVNYDTDTVQSPCFPIFRYFNEKHGMCEVESIHFRKGKSPKITYKISGIVKANFSSFDTKYLMQAVNLIDSDGKILYEGDICLLKNRKKLVFDSIDKLETFKKLDKFKIVDNVFYGEFKNDDGRNHGEDKNINSRRLQKRSRKSY